MDVASYNKTAWDRKVNEQNRWTLPVSREEVDRARRGELEVLLTPTRPTPLDWFPPLFGQRVLCLACGGGQQGPLLAAAGGIVTVFDNSPRQLAQDRFVAERDGLTLTTAEGDMRDLSRFPAAAFDLVFNPCSNCFVPDVRPVWRECARVLRKGGALLAGFCNPLRFIFDDERAENGNLEVRHSIPYSDLTHLTDQQRETLVTGPGKPLEFGHSLEDQIGGQLAAGFMLHGFYEDRYDESGGDPISRYIATFIGTRAVKA